jgi:hypothetical protein
MFHIIVRHLSQVQQGLIALIVGFVLFFGALGKLGFLQEFLNIIMVIVGIYLLIFGLDKSGIWKKINFLKKQ